MRFIARLLDDYYAEHGTSFFRRIVLAFVFGTIMGALCIWRTQRKWGMAPKDMGLCALGMGVAVMIVAIFMNLSSALWSKGILAKLCAAILFLIGCVVVLAFICFAAARML